MRYFKPISYLYFFLNSFLLPHGLLYTTIISPFLLVWLLKIKKAQSFAYFLFVAALFIPFQFYFNTEVELFFYVRSLALYFMLFACVIALAQMLSRIKEQQFRKLMSGMIKVNFVILLLASSLTLIPFGAHFWMDGRLNLLNYEPSYYATLMLPLVVYAISEFMFSPKLRTFFLLLMIIAPFLLTGSVGCIGALFIALAFVVGLNPRVTLLSPPMLVLILLAMVLIGVMITVNDYIIGRAISFLTTSDSSGSVRVFQSSMVAFQIAESTSFFFGSGFGQSKLLAIDFFNEYWPGLEVDRIANVMASTFAEFGIFGVLIRLSLIVYLFFRSKVMDCFFRFTLFATVFVYQFTGSYLSNLAEYVIWIIAFTPVISRYSLRGLYDR